MDDRPMLRSGPIRYAEAERFAPPRPPSAAGARPPGGRICPQPPSRLDAVMGPPHDRRPQSEDCLHLTVTTPARDDGARPVLVWLHGGGFSSGGGVLDWYDGGALAAEGDAVVVGVNYRLGALGYLVLDGVSDGNLGLLDQLEALRWVRDHIADWGGDPGNVTVFGQSAGALSIRLLMAVPEADGLFRRALLQSAPLPIAARSRQEARDIGHMFADHLGCDPRTADPEALLAAQGRTAADHQRRSGSALEPPFTPVTGTAPLAAPGLGLTARAGELDVMYGWNAEDMSAFPPLPGETGTVAERTRQVYEMPLAHFGGQLRRAGARLHAYRLDWRPAGSPLGATHCVELPLLLGSRDAWRGAPMLGETAWGDIDSLGRAVRACWLAFARTGDPGALPAPLVSVSP
ncbi:carboxylesterase family protein [Streptomyces tubbatahanensis]|uniref:Carboxylesterase family protein n=1 Tax=Streptomyces tubbatahanensis TaxID=2923272 RepID=A0ABY3XM57_9ACTN|nr:carboxylesterase family protein [Streptomyces tubbatahanensis]UNS95480.1 carboxylesterase family protein [Streptomyces tubbatahanensis]